MTETITSAPPAVGAAEENEIRNFEVDVPEEELVDLRRRIEATRLRAAFRSLRQEGRSS